MLTNVFFILLSLLPKVITTIRLSFVYWLSWTYLARMETWDSYNKKNLTLGPSFVLCGWCSFYKSRRLMNCAKLVWKIMAGPPWSPGGSEMNEEVEKFSLACTLLFFWMRLLVRTRTLIFWLLFCKICGCRSLNLQWALLVN